MRTLEGRCALITGSTQGLGLAAAHRFAAAGAHVVLSGLASPEEAAATASALESAHGVRALYAAGDLSRPADIESIVDTAKRAFGAVDILVNNAVVRHAAPIEAFGADRWDEGLAVNLSAAFHLIRLTVPMMQAGGWGRILNVSSIYGFKGAANRVAYVTTKTALLGLTRAVALEGLPHGITCNAVCPGTTETPVHEAAIQASMATQSITREEAERRFFATKQPTGRFISAEQVAALMVFLCGPDASDINGAALPVDGAWSAS
ncbi:MAG TPA: SDR family NAD(P)-dependent oxidoreductase [Vicinamibacterales bacterium]|jgi:3-hydroxybutyrate dehydrogenase|nr:SDR family NAD(P)-dependent oxidoreductase [Vicinamibacterales bacterium]